jgi:septal ring factor EnvC (AmiA/AmiB activator)
MDASHAAQSEASRASTTSTAKKSATTKSTAAKSTAAKSTATKSTAKATNSATGAATSTKTVKPKAANGTHNSANGNAQKLQETQRQTREQQEALRGKLHELKKDLAQTEASRNEAADALAQVEQTISAANRKLRQLVQNSDALEAALRSLNTEETDIRARMGAQQTRLAALLQRQYLNGSPDQLRLLFNGENPSHIQRELQYLSYISKANANLIQSLRQDVARLDELEAQTKTKQQELHALRQAQESERKSLLAEQEKRKVLLAGLANKIATQRREVGALERDEQRLSQLVDNLGKQIVQQALKEKAEQAEQAKQAEKRRQALAAQEAADKHADRQKANAQKPTGRDGSATVANKPVPDKETSGYTPSGRVDSVADASANVSDFAALRGQLKLPVRGELLGRFGAPRNQIGMQGGTTWKGVFIRAHQGAEVKAVAPGRVVFAEWLRGFGNLLIVDHGHQYLSIYGNNEALFKQPGEKVKAGEAVASVGNSGGNPETGLYFELRHQGQPFDPLKWAAGK